MLNKCIAKKRNLGSVHNIKRVSDNSFLQTTRLCAPPLFPIACCLGLKRSAPFLKRIQCHTSTLLIHLFPRLCQLCAYYASYMLTNTTDIFYMLVVLALLIVRCRRFLQRTNAVSCAAALPTQPQHISVSISDHNHNSGPMMSIATFALMNEETIAPEQCLPSHQFNLSLSTLQARGQFLKKYFSCH